MSAEIITLYTTIDRLIGDGLALEPDTILDAAKGKYHSVVIVGETDGGGIEVCGTHSAAETLLLLQWASQFIVANKVAR